MTDRWILCSCLIIALLSQGRAIGTQDPPESTATPSADWTRVAPGGDTACAFGTPYSFFHRGGASPNLLLIYFQGGGACWNWVSCSGLFDTRVEADELAEFRGIFDQANPDNPFEDYDAVFVPYCTGDVHIGDTSRMYGDDPSSRPVAHRGYRNTRAVLDWLAAQGRRRSTVVVAGTSAGAYGALFYVPEVRRLFPTATIVFLGDSGVPLLSDNQQVFQSWGAAKVFSRIWHADGAPPATQASLLEAYRQAAAGGPQVRLALITSDQDAIQSAFYLISGSPGWREATYALLRDVKAAVPSFRSFVVSGSDHGLLPTDAFYSYTVDGVALKDWVDQLVRNEPIGDVRCAQCVMQ